MPYLVFSQQSLTSLDVARLVQHAKRFFGLGFEVRECRREGETGELVMVVTGGSGAVGPPLHARVRACAEGDYEAAERAERAGSAGGMAALARRCRFVWELEPGAAAEVEVCRLCAILASVLLGPVMPPDGSTLFGVRGARERAERLERSCILR